MLVLDYSLPKEGLSRQVSRSIGFGPFEMLSNHLFKYRRLTFSTENHE